MHQDVVFGTVKIAPPRISTTVSILMVMMFSFKTGLYSVEQAGLELHRFTRLCLPRLGGVKGMTPRSPANTLLLLFYYKLYIYLLRVRICYILSVL